MTESFTLKNIDFPMTASRSRRFFAAMLDMIITPLISSVLYKILTPVFLILSAEPISLTVFGILASAAVYFLVVIYPLLRWEVTAGKKILGIKLVDSTGAQLTVWQILGREVIGKTISAALLGIGYLMILGPKKKALHDIIFNTQVVREE